MVTHFECYEIVEIHGRLFHFQMERENTSPCNTKQFLEGFSEHPPAAAASPSPAPASSAAARAARPWAACQVSTGISLLL